MKTGERFPIPEQTIKPIFIAGMDGSGTTMLLDCLGLHSKLYAFPNETRVIPFLQKKTNDFGDLKEDENFYKLWDMVRKIPAFQGANQFTPCPLPDNWKQFPRSLAAVLDVYFQYFARKKDNLENVRWCEKTPKNIQNFDIIANMYEQAKFIHIIRDGRDCAASLYRRWNRSPQLSMFKWKNTVKLGKQYKDSLNERYMEIKYEDLTNNPELHLRRICNFLEIEFEKKILLAPERQRNKRVKNVPIKYNTGNWNKYFSKTMVKKLEAIGGKTLLEMGYAAEYEALDNNPSDFAIKYWHKRDNFLRALQILWKKITGRRNEWSLIFILRGKLVSMRQNSITKF